MQDNQIIDRYEDLKGMESSQLSAILRAETNKDVPDDDLVLQILHILEDREPDPTEPEVEKEKAAWRKFLSRARARKRRRMFAWQQLVKAASVCIVAGLMLVALIPQNVEADSFWDRVARWTDDFFAFFYSDDEEDFLLEDYEFVTENSGLQQVYDAVVEMGITEPVVPMWIPEGYELVECQINRTPARHVLFARFLNGTEEMVVQVNVSLSGEVNNYFKDETKVITVEQNGITHNIVRNNTQWDVIWVKDNIECAIFIDCQEEILYEIISSIYRWRISE